MDRVCECGNRVTALLMDLGCLRCGARCCPACAFAIDAATYCVGCAEAILEAEGVSLNLSLPRDPGRPSRSPAGSPGKPA